MSTSKPGGIPTIVFGAFDRHNFGDLLFPHVVAALTDDDELIFAGLADRDLCAYGGHRVHAVASLAAGCGKRPVNILHAGGELLTCDAWQAAVMLQPAGQAQALIRYFDARPQERQDWVRRTLGLSSCAPYTVPRRLFAQAAGIVYNAVGGMDFASRDAGLRNEVLANLREADAIGVRDRLTQAQLAAEGIATLLLPDCAVMVAELFGERIRHRAATGDVAGIAQAFPEGYIAVQFSAGFGDDRTLGIIAAQLDEAVKQTGCNAVFFRAGAAPWHDELSIYESVVARMRSGTARIFTSLDIWDICALIASSRAYLGSSLHGRIVAMAFAIPRMNLRDPSHPSGLSKPSAFATTWEAAGTLNEVGVQELAQGLTQAMAADRSALAHTASRLAREYRAGFAALRARLKGRPA